MSVSEITPETKVKLSLKDVIVIILALAGFIASGLTYFGVIPNKSNAQTQMIACDTCPNLVTRDKLIDTVLPLQLQIDNLKSEIKEFKDGQREMQKDIKEILKQTKGD